MKAMVLKQILKSPLQSYFKKWKNIRKSYSKVEILTLKLMIKNLKLNHYRSVKNSFINLKNYVVPVAGSGSAKGLNKKVYKYDENTSFNINQHKFKSNTSNNDRYSRNQRYD